MAPGLEDEDYDEPKDDEQEEENALPPASVLLVPVACGNQKGEERSDSNRYQSQHVRAYGPSRDFKLLYCVVHVGSRLLDIVFDAVKERALVYDE